MKKELPLPIVVSLIFVAITLVIGIGWRYMNRDTPLRSQLPGVESNSRAALRRTPMRGGPRD